MSFVKKLKDILFEEEEYTEPIKIRDEKKERIPEEIKVNPTPMVESKSEVVEEVKPSSPAPTPTSERDLFKSDNTFKFPDFDEEEFTSSMSQSRSNHNILEVERKKTVEKRTDYGRYERIETKEYTEKKKFKPSPIISPVYGILNQDYKAEDIIKKEDSASNIDIDSVRKKAFEKNPEEKEIKKVVEKEEILEPENKEVIDEPVVTFFDEKDKDPKKDNYKTIDDLLEEASSEITLEDTLEIPKTNNLDAIEEELEKIDIEESTKEKNLEDTLENDVYDLIDSMYDEREEG